MVICPSLMSLVDEYGPVIIDLPQAVNASANNNAEWMFARDVNNMRSYYAQYAPELSETEYAKEMWQLYQLGKLQPDTKLTGQFTESDELADVEAILDEIAAAKLEAEMRELSQDENDSISH